MTDPLSAIAAEGAAIVAPAVAPPGFLAGALGRLMSASPRSEVELSADAFAQLINAGLDARSGNAASQSKLGEGVMDCAYALMPADGGFSGASPLARLFSAVVGFIARLKARGRKGVPPQTPHEGAVFAA